MSKILITGGKGKLATEFRKNYTCDAPAKQELDITNYHQVRDYLKHHTDIHTIIHAGAMTSVEQCEVDQEQAYRVNIGGTINILQAIMENSNYESGARRHFKLVYISTPCIFDGKTGNYDEDSIPNPQNYYGMTKTISEELIKNSGIKHVIIRANFVPRETWAYPKAFIDRFGTYLYADQVAEKMAFHISNSEGIVHIVGKDKLSMFDLAEKLTPKIKPLVMRHYKGKAKLTVDMTMISKKRWELEIR